MPPQPRSCSFSGTSTISTPKSSAGRTTSQIATKKLRSARRRAESRSGRAGVPGVSARNAQRTRPAALTATKVGRTPATVATAPSAGPSSDPKTAAPITVPISVPRRLGGPAATTHASAPAHENALPTPWANRAAPSAVTSLARPKPRLAAAVRATPTRTAGRGPKREAASPPGTDAASTPAAYKAESTPAPPFPSP